MEKILITDDEKRLSQILSRISSQKERIVLQNKEGEEYVIVSKDEAILLDKLTDMFAEILEDRFDAEEAMLARKRIAEDGGVSFEEVKANLGINDEDL